MFSTFRRRVAVISALAVIGATVPALSNTTATAAPAVTAITAATLDAPAAYLACPASANIPSAGFEDTTDASVDCLKYFGIVNGTTATTYSPTDTVSRWQMALFLTRTLNVANVALPTGADQGFTDIAGESAEIQLAINQLKQLGITTGKTATTFAPADNVSRQEMALFIERMLDNLPAGPGGVSEADAAGTSDASISYINSNCGEGAGVKTCTGQYNYTDVDAGSVTVEASLAIKELFTLGIHEGVSATTFNPTGDMSRASMATMINAALNHSHLRPEGLHLQSSSYSALGTHTPAMSVSYRDASFDAIANASVDVFYWTNSTVEGNAAFLATGACDDSLATALSITACYIDVNEPKTDENGNMTPTANGTAPVSTVFPGTDTYYAWTAPAATTYDNDLHGETPWGVQHSSVNVVANPAAASLRCKMDTPAQAAVATAAHTMKFGATTVVTCETVNLTAGATAATVPQAGSIVRFDHTRVFTTDSTGVQTGETILANSTLGITDATGTVTFTITGPTDTAGTDVVTDSIQITGVSGTGVTAEYAFNTTANTSGHFADDGNDLQATLVYQDGAASVNHVTATQTSSNGAGSALGVTRSVTANVWGNYGDPVAGETVTFTDVNYLPDRLGVVCTAATPTVCTTEVAHGMAAGDDVKILSLGSATDCLPTGGALMTTATTTVNVGTESLTATTFSLDGTGDTDLGCTTAAVAATPLQIAGTSFDNAANNTRVTGSTGAATFSWVDTETESGMNTVTATTTTNSRTRAIDYYRTTTVPAAYAEAGNFDGTLDDNEGTVRIVESNMASDNMIVEFINAGATGTATNNNPTMSYHKVLFDSNDSFASDCTNANIQGTARTQAAFEGATFGVATLMINTVAGYNNGLIGPLNSICGWNYDALSTGVSRIYLG